MFIAPMLAGKMPEGRALTWYENKDDWVAEEKFDGHRIGFRVTDSEYQAWSRLENTRRFPTHIEDKVVMLPNGYYDGEILAGQHSWDVAAGANSGTERLVVFDMLEVLGTSIMSMPYHSRRKYLEVAFERFNGDNPAVSITAQLAPSQTMMDSILAREGEGLILKHTLGLYRPNWRSPDWLKVKQVQEAELTVIGFTAGENGAYSTVDLRDDAGNETSVKTKNAVELRKIAAAPDTYIGKRLEITFQLRTPSGNYRHPMWHRWAGPHE